MKKSIISISIADVLLLSSCGSTAVEVHDFDNENIPYAEIDNICDLIFETKASPEKVAKIIPDYYISENDDIGSIYEIVENIEEDGYYSHSQLNYQNDNLKCYMFYNSDKELDNVSPNLLSSIRGSDGEFYDSVDKPGGYAIVIDSWNEDFSPEKKWENIVKELEEGGADFTDNGYETLNELQYTYYDKFTLEPGSSGELMGEGVAKGTYKKRKFKITFRAEKCTTYPSERLERYETTYDTGYTIYIQLGEK